MRTLCLHNYLYVLYKYFTFNTDTIYPEMAVEEVKEENNLEELG
ncbi:hypothetical protein [Microcystis sp. M090S1]|nr:hypothetical protein [Microcystis sp. M090S1]